MTENQPRRVPSFFLLVPGPWTEASQILAALADHDIEAHLQGEAPPQLDQILLRLVEDDRLAEGFTWGRLGPLPDDLVRQVAAHRHAALLQVGCRLDQAPDRIAALGRALRDAGGVAVRMEASGGAWAWEPWLERLDSGLPEDLVEAAVITVRGEENALFTCGMRHFDLPDAQITMESPSEAISWLDIFHVWQLAEAPVLVSGQTFRPDEASQRRVVERWPDHRHHTQDGRHNPFGLWRFLPVGQTGLEPSASIPVIIPSLLAMLASLEDKKGRPLTQDEVEEMVYNAPAIVMEHPHAVTLERSRGYVDLEPELAWEQWQLVRPTL